LPYYSVGRWVSEDTAFLALCKAFVDLAEEKRSTTD